MKNIKQNNKYSKSKNVLGSFIVFLVFLTSSNILQADDIIDYTLDSPSVASPNVIPLTKDQNQDLRSSAQSVGILDTDVEKTSNVSASSTDTTVTPNSIDTSDSSCQITKESLGDAAGCPVVATPCILDEPLSPPIEAYAKSMHEMDTMQEALDKTRQPTDQTTETLATSSTESTSESKSFLKDEVEIKTVDILEDKNSSKNWISGAQRVDSIIAEVEGRVITMHELFEQLAPLIPQIQRESQSQTEFTTKLKALEKQVLDNMIDGVLIVKEFDRKKFTIPKSALDSEINEFIQTRFNGDKSQLVKYLQSIGKSMRQFREDMRERIIIQVMQDQMMRSRSEVSPEKIKLYYQEHKLEFVQEETYEIAQITLKGSLEERAEKAGNIIRQLKIGVRFSELAKKYSQDNKAQEGGYWGWITKNNMRNELADALNKISIRQYTQPIVLEERTYILYLNNRKREGFKPLEEVRIIIEEQISQELSKQTYNNWLERLRKNAYIKYY